MTIYLCTSIKEPTHHCPSTYGRKGSGRRFSIIPALKDPTTTTALILKTHDTVTSLPTTIHNDTPDDSTNDHSDPLIHHPKDMTVLQLLSAVVKPKPQLGNEQ